MQPSPQQTLNRIEFHGNKKIRPRQGSDFLFDLWEKRGLFDLNQLILATAHSQLDCVLQTAFPVGVRVGVGEVVVMTMLALCQNAAADDRLTVDGIRTGLVECNRVEGGEHTDIGHDWNVVLWVAVAVRRNIDDQADVEVRLVLDDRIGVFGNLAVEDVVCLADAGFDRILRTSADAASTAHALVVVDVGAFAGILCSARLPGLFSPS